MKPPMVSSNELLIKLDQASPPGTLAGNALADRSPAVLTDFWVSVVSPRDHRHPPRAMTGLTLCITTPTVAASCEYQSVGVHEDNSLADVLGGNYASRERLAIRDTRTPRHPRDTQFPGVGVGGCCPIGCEWLMLKLCLTPVAPRGACGATRWRVVSTRTGFLIPSGGGSRCGRTRWKAV